MSETVLEKHSTQKNSSLETAPKENIHQCLPSSGTVSPLSLRHNISYAFIGNLTFAACQWGLIVLFARLGGPEIVGAYVLALAVCNPVFMFCSLELRTLLATDTNNLYSFSDYLRLRILAVSLAIFLSIIVGVLFQTDSFVLSIVVIVAVIKSFEWILDILYGLWQKLERLDTVGRSACLHGLTDILSASIAMYFTQDLRLALAAYLLSHVFFMAVYDIPSLRQLRSSLNREIPTSSISGAIKRSFSTTSRNMLKRLTWVGLPLAGTSMFVSLTTCTPRLVLSQWGTLFEVGILGSIASLNLCGGIIARAVNAALSSQLAKSLQQKDVRRFRRLLLKTGGIYVAIACVGLLVAYLIGDQLLSFIFGFKSSYSMILIFVLIGMLFSMLSNLVHLSLITVRWLSALLPLSMLTWLWTAIFCLLLVPRLGIQGAAISIALSRFPYCCLGAVCVHIRLKKIRSAANIETKNLNLHKISFLKKAG